MYTLDVGSASCKRVVVVATARYRHVCLVTIWHGLMFSIIAVFTRICSELLLDPQSDIPGIMLVCSQQMSACIKTSCLKYNLAIYSCRTTEYTTFE